MLIDFTTAEAKRRVDEACANTWSCIVELCQCINAWKEGCSQRDVETSHSWDSQSQTCHTRDDEPGPSHRKDLHPTREGHEQDGQVHHPSKELNDRSHWLSPWHIQRHIVLDEETPVNIVAKSWQEAEYWEWLENDAAKHHREALDHMIRPAAEAVEFAKANNLLSQDALMTYLVIYYPVLFVPVMVQNRIRGTGAIWKAW